MITISYRASFSSFRPQQHQLLLLKATRLDWALDDHCARLGAGCVKLSNVGSSKAMLHCIKSTTTTSSLARTSLLVSNSWLSSARHQLGTTTNVGINSLHLTSSSCQTHLNSKQQIKNNLTLIRQFYSETRPILWQQKLESSTRRMSSMADCKIISGKEVSDEIRASLKAKVEGMTIKPRLAIVQVGGREDSNVYIRMKVQFAQSIGGSTELIKLGRETTEEELAEKVSQLNRDTSIHGIITQLPFDSANKIDSDRIVNLIDPKKDVDGLSVHSAGTLLHGKLGGSSFIPCTPKGCMELIRRAGIKVEGSRSVVFGRSKIVGSPMAQLLLWNNSTVTLCHSKTANPKEICREADIVVIAVGQSQMVKRDWLKPGAVVIDCGINVIPDATKKSGTRLVGDADFEGCKEVAGAITPVPGGVGPMTVAMLISNTVEAAERASRQ